MGAARREKVIDAGAGEPVALVRYDAACRAIAEAKSVDEVKHIRGVAAALRAYAKQAKNRQMEIDAAEIRIRAERRVGEMIAMQRETVGLAKAGRRPSKEIELESNSINSVPTLKQAGIDPNLANRARKLAAIPARQFEQQIETWRDRAEQPTGGRVTTDLHFSSASPEHYTPRPIIDAVIACLGGIDLDPCSDAGHNVPAGRYYTSADDGLAQPWIGTVYMNPPYGDQIDAWVSKLCAEHIPPGGVTAAIALVPARTDTQWFQKLRDYCCCFITGRLTFGGNKDPAPFPSAVFYLGEDIGSFYHHFAPFGDIWQRLEPGISFGE
jgi:hypothetical protein